MAYREDFSYAVHLMFTQVNGNNPVHEGSILGSFKGIIKALGNSIEAKI